MAVSQLGIAREYQNLYDPIIGTTEDEGRSLPDPTPREKTDQASDLHQAYSSLKDELLGEISAIESQLLRPATDVREMIRPIQKTIKKRDHKRMDLATAQEKVTKMQRKEMRSIKEETQLAKAQEELAHLSEVRSISSFTTLSDGMSRVAVFLTLSTS